MKVRFLLILLIVTGCASNTSPDIIFYQGVGTNSFVNKDIGKDATMAMFDEATGEAAKLIRLWRSGQVELKGFVAVAMGELTIFVKDKDIVIWQRSISANEQVNLINEKLAFPDVGDYVLYIKLTNATGHYNLRWKNTDGADAF